MKSAIALCFLAVLCATDATVLDLLLIRVRNAKISVDNTVRQLERLRADVEQETDLAIMQKWLKEMEKHKRYVEPVLAKIVDEVEAAKAKGKDAQPCYNAAYSMIKNADCTAYDDARKCQENSRNGIRSNLEFIIDNLVSAGRDLITELDNIFPDCYAKVTGIWDAIKLRRCIINKLGISNVSVKNLKKDATSARATAKHTSSIVVKQGTECLNNAYSAAHSKIDEAKESAIRCINRLEPN